MGKEESPKRMTDEEVVDKVFTIWAEDMIFKCKTISDVEKVDAHIIERMVL